MKKQLKSFEERLEKNCSDWDETLRALAEFPLPDFSDDACSICPVDGQICNECSLPIALKGDRW